MCSLSALIITVLIARSVNCYLLPKVTFITNEELSEKFTNFAHQFDIISFSNKKLIVNQFQQFLNSNESEVISKQCLSAINYTINGLADYDRNAYKFYELNQLNNLASFGQTFSTNKQLINQCLNIGVATLKNNEFQGKFCFVNVKFNLESSEEFNGPISQTALKLNSSFTSDNNFYQFLADHIELFKYDGFNHGICVPSTCAKTDINLFVNIIKKINGFDAISVTLRDYCQTNDEKHRDHKVSRAITSGFVLSLFAILVAICTTVEFLLDEIMIEKPKAVMIFSLKSNWKKFSNVNVSGAQNRLVGIDSIKCWGQLWAMIGHIFLCHSFRSAFPIMSEMRTELMGFSAGLADFAARFLFSTQFMLVISGFINYLLLGKLLTKDSPVNMNFMVFVLKRYLRLLPPVIATIFLTFVVASYVEHPVAREVMTRLSESCEKNWWKTLLMVNNYDAPFIDICVMQSWYISVDMQLWIMSYVPFMLLARKPRAGVALCIFLIALGCFLNGFITWWADLDVYFTGRELEIMRFLIFGNQMTVMHFSVHNYIATYFTGVLTAYFCSSFSRPEMLSLRFLKIMSLPLLSGLIILLLPSYLIASNSPLMSNVVFELLYSAVFRVSFALVMIVVFYGIYFDYDKKLLHYNFIRLKVWALIAKILYSVFLVHFLLVILLLTVVYDNVPGNLFSWLLFVFNFIFISCAAGLALHLTVEMPCANLTNELFKVLLVKKTPECVEKCK